MIEVIVTAANPDNRKEHTFSQSFSQVREGNAWARMWAANSKRVELRPFEDRRSRPRCETPDCPYCGEWR